MTLQQLFYFFKGRNPAPLAYYFARQRFSHRDKYAVPEFLAYVTDSRTHRHLGKGTAA